MTDKLRECPFCGVQLENYPPSEIWVHPDNGCLLSLRGITKEQFSAWNTRKPMDRIAEKLEEEVTEIGSRVCNNTKCNHECVNNAGMCDHGVLMGAVIDAIVKGVQNACENKSE